MILRAWYFRIFTKVLSLTFLFIFYTSFPLIAQKKKSTPKSYSEYKKLAEAVIDEGRYSELVAIHEKSREQALKEFGRESKEYTEACGLLAMAYQSNEQFSKAEGFYKEQWELARKVWGESSHEFIIVSIEYGWVFHVQGDDETAEMMLQKTLVLAEEGRGKLSTDYISVCNALAELKREQGDYRTAETYYLVSKGLCEKMLDSISDYYARTNYELSQVYEREGLFDKAESLLLQTKDTVEKYLGKENLNYSFVCTNLGDLYTDREEYDKAEALYLEDLKISEKILGKENTQYGVRLNALAIYYNRLEMYDSAETLYNQVLPIYERAWGKGNEYNIVIRNLATLYKNQGNYDKSIELLKEALKIALRVWGKEHPEYGMVCNQIGRVYEAKNEFKKAELYLLKDLRILENHFGPDHPDFAKTASSLGYLYEKEGLFQKAAPLYHRVVQNKIYQANILLPVMTEKERQQYIASIQEYFLGYYDFAIKALSDTTVLINLFDIQLAMKGIIFHSTRKIQEEIFQSGNDTLIQRYYDWKSKRELLTRVMHMCREEKEKMKISEQSLLTEIEEMERALSLQTESFSKNQQEDITWKDIQQKLDKDEAAVEILRAWKYKLDQPVFEYIGKGYRYDSSASGGFEVVSVYPVCSAQRAGITEGMKIVAVNGQDVLSKTRHEFTVMLKGNSYALTVVHPATSEVTTHTLVSDSIFSIGTTKEPVYMALVITPATHNHPEVVVLENGEDLEKKGINYYKNHIRYKLKDLQSYNRFWKEIKAKTGDAKKVYVSCDGIYHQINLHTLLNPDTRNYAADETEIHLVTNTKDILKYATDKSREEVLNNYRIHLFGYPNYAADGDSIGKDTVRSDTIQRFFDPEGVVSMLPGTKKEIEAIYDLLKEKFPHTRKFLYNEATEEELKKLKNPAILHLATHGYFLPNPENSSIESEEPDNPMARSGLLLYGCMNNGNDSGEDGIVKAEEAMNLCLDKTDLVVLSACETGLGEIYNGEGVYGLQRAFQQAGARTIIMSLWKVDDSATQEMMNLFYKYYMNGNSKRRAFVLAQHDLRSKFPEPYYWGAFVMVGE